MHESPGLNPDCLGDVKLFFERKIWNILYSILWNVFFGNGTQKYGTVILQ